jgi:hypothetical protein
VAKQRDARRGMTVMDSIRWRNVATMGLWVAGAMSLVLASASGLEELSVHRHRATLDAPPRPAPDPVQVSLLRTLYARHALMGYEANFDEGVPSWVPLLLDRSPALCQADAHEPCEGGWLVAQLLDPHAVLGAPLALRQALVTANARAVKLPDPGLPGLRAEPAESLNWLFAGTDDGWDNLQRLRPRVTVILRPARAVVSADGAQALLLTYGDCGRGCAKAELAFLARDGSRWSLIDRIRLHPGGELPRPLPPLPPPRERD